MKGILLPLILLASTVSTPAQESPSYKISDHVLNAGGENLIVSDNYRLSLSAMGDGLAATDLTSASYELDAGFTVCYPPPGEVAPCHGVPCADPLLEFTDRQTLIWPAEPSVGAYNLYRDLLGNLDPPQYGPCLRERIPGTTTVDADTPPVGDGYFYLVTAENRLAEEGSLGFDSAGAVRPNLGPCP